MGIACAFCGASETHSEPIFQVARSAGRTAFLPRLQESQRDKTLFNQPHPCLCRISQRCRCSLHSHQHVFEGRSDADRETETIP